MVVLSGNRTKSLHQEDTQTLLEDSDTRKF
jgi:hypothetical protein